MATFKAVVIAKTESGTAAALTDFDEQELMEGDVTLRPEWSTVNYKDGLAITGKAPVVRRFPMIAGVDAAATVDVRRFVLTSILTCDKTPQVPHFGTRNSSKTASRSAESGMSRCGPELSLSRSRNSVATRSPGAG